MKADLSGRVSLVTGAARGIGEAIADRLAANGSRVVHTDVADAARAAQKSPGGVAMTLDVTNPSQVQGIIERGVDEFGRLDILVNNAGINTLAHRVTIDEYPREAWDPILAVDFLADPENTYAHGHILTVDGGWTAGYAREF